MLDINKTLIMFAILLVSLVSISAVCAEDVSNETDVIAVDSENEEVSIDAVEVETPLAAEGDSGSGSSFDISQLLDLLNSLNTTGMDFGNFGNMSGMNFSGMDFSNMTGNNSSFDFSQIMDILKQFMGGNSTSSSDAPASATSAPAPTVKAEVSGHVTAQPILALLVVLVAIGASQFRRFKK